MNLTYFSPKIEKRGSEIEGRGLFDLEPISKDEIVVVKGGYVITTVQRDEVSKELGPAEVQVIEGLHIGPVLREERGRRDDAPQPLLRA